MILVLAVLAAGGIGCRTQQPRRFLDQTTVLNREIQGLRELILRAEKGTLFPKDQVVIAVSEELVKDVAQLALPREQVIGKRFRVRLEKADVRFRDKHGSVRLDGRVSPVDHSPEDVFADVAVFGLMDAVEVDASTGVLRASVSVIGFELQRVGVFGESVIGRRLLEELAERHADDLKALAFPLTIPVHVQEQIALPGLEGSGPVRLRGVSFPLSVKVADVVAHGNRLWVALDVRSGSWTKAEGARRAESERGGRERQ